VPTNPSNPGTTAACVPGNRWDRLETPGPAQVAAVGVTLVVPASSDPVRWDLVVAALRAQQHPVERLEVVVIGGDDQRQALAAGFPGCLVRSVTPVPGPAGAWSARNLAAREASHPVVLFLDADQLPAPGLIAAHARWHAAGGPVAVLGRDVTLDRDPVADPMDPGAGDGSTPSAADRWVAELPTDAGDPPGWVTGILLRTDDLRSDASDIFRVVTSGNLSVERDTFEAAGGYWPELVRAGADDPDLGFRLLEAGVLLVPEPAAVAWRLPGAHDAERATPGAGTPPSRSVRAAQLAQRVAHRTHRRGVAGRVPALPRWTVVVDPGEVELEAVVATVESVLVADTPDLRIHLGLPAAADAAAWVAAAFGPDPRIVVDPADEPRSPLRLHLPAGWALEPGTLDTLDGLLDAPSEPVGVLRLTLPGCPPGARHAVASRTRALARGRRCRPDAPVEAAASLFGVHWVSGRDVGLHPVAPGEARVTATAAAPEPQDGSGDDELRALMDTLAALPPPERQAVLQAARAVLDAPDPLRRAAVRAARLVGRRG
jgi:hypothetical protein